MIHECVERLGKDSKFPLGVSDPEIMLKTRERLRSLRRNSFKADASSSTLNLRVCAEPMKLVPGPVPALPAPAEPRYHHAAWTPERMHPLTGGPPGI